MAEKNNPAKRLHGEGSIYRMKNGKYGGAVSLGLKADGKRDRPVVTGKTEAEVKMKMEELLRERGLIKTDAPVTVSSTGDLTVEDAINKFIREEFIEVGEITSRTLESYIYHLAILKEKLGERKIAKIMPRDIKLLYNGLIKDKSDNHGNMTEEYRYSQRVLSMVGQLTKRLLKWAMKEGLVESAKFTDDDLYY